MTRKKTRAKSPLRAAAKPSDIVFAASDINIEASAETGAPEVNVTAYTGDMLSLANFPNPAVINLAGKSIFGRWSDRCWPWLWRDLRQRCGGRTRLQRAPSSNNPSR